MKVKILKIQNKEDIKKQKEILNKKINFSFDKINKQIIKYIK